MSTKPMITLKQASIQTGYTESYLRQLLRAESIVGKKIGDRLWLMDAEAVSRLAKKPYSRGRPKSKNAAKTQGK